MRSDVGHGPNTLARPQLALRSNVLHSGERMEGIAAAARNAAANVNILSAFLLSRSRRRLLMPVMCVLVLTSCAHSDSSTASDSASPFVAASGVVLSAAPNPVDTKKFQGPPSTRITWKLPGAARVEIHVESPDGTLWTEGGASGSAQTGAWVRNGLKFYLLDISQGKPGRLAAVLTVATCTGCSK
jgi:hypothetical protein